MSILSRLWKQVSSQVWPFAKHPPLYFTVTNLSVDGTKCVVCYQDIMRVYVISDLEDKCDLEMFSGPIIHTTAKAWKRISRCTRK